ncbi:unnamed protein product [Sympodiomycopsis kandeliae]
MSSPPKEPLLKASQLFNETQAKVMMAIADALVPGLKGQAAADLIASLPITASQAQRDLVAKFAHEGFSDHPELLDKFARQAATSLSAATMGDITLLLTVLGTRLGCLALTGHVGPYYELDRKTREGAIHGWSQSPIGLFNKAASGLKGLTLMIFYRANPTAWKAIGYSDGVNTDWRDAASEEEQVNHYKYIFENEKFSHLPADAEITIDTDMLIIGSGSGGGVAASYLSKRGVKTLVVDKGIYLQPSDMIGSEDQGYTSLYEAEGIMPTEDGSVNILAGSTFGGGTTVNWSASLKPRHFVRRTWSEKYGVPYYTSPNFTNDLNAVCDRMGVAIQPIKHNVSNSLLALGSQRAGHPVEAVPQNSGGHTHYCGKCQFGCISGHKQGGTVTWLRDSAERGGAFMTNTFIERILFDDKTKRKAIGAVGWVDGRRVTIKAARGVVCSAGSIQTPALLLRSPELNYNKMIGKTLHLHPTTIVTGYYDFAVKPWEGSLLTMVNNAAEMVDPAGWGAKIEVIASSPGISAAFANFESSEEHKRNMLRYSHSYTIIVLTRDRDPGRVVIDKGGQARVEYSVSKHDQESAAQGILRACDAHMMAGAAQIATAQVSVPPFKPRLKAPPSSQHTDAFPESTSIPSTSVPVPSVPNDLNDPLYKEWQQKILKVGARPYWCMFGSAHQMASCRMSGSPKLGTCDPEGRVWGSKNLWVADASSICESSGVNPMITTMATAWGISRNIARDLGIENDSQQVKANQLQGKPTGGLGGTVHNGVQATTGGVSASGSEKL